MTWESSVSAGHPLTWLRGRAKTLWTRCSLWVTHPDLEFGTRKTRKEWRFSAELHLPTTSTYICPGSAPSMLLSPGARSRGRFSASKGGEQSWCNKWTAAMKIMFV